MTHLSLVTGGAGFVGRHLVEALLARGEKVRVLDLDIGPLEGMAIEPVEGSITDPDIVTHACAGVDSVFHLAGNAQLWSKNPAVFDTVNHHGTEVMVTGAVQAGVKTFIHCSSLTTLVGRSTVIGQSQADETIQLPVADMLGPYPASKRRAELIALAQAEGSEMEVIVAIPTEPLGAGDDSLTPPTRMILDFVNGKTPAFIDCILNFVPAVSLARGFIAARDKGRNGERYLLGGENVPMRLLLDKLAKQTGKKMPSVKMPYGVALMAGLVDTKLVAGITGKPPKAPLTGVRLAGRQVSFISDKAKRDLDWRADDVDSALREMLDWAREKGLASF